jgi:hypothetical protein
MKLQKRKQSNESNPLLDPVIRKEFLDHMTQMCVQWNDEVLEGWLEQPYDNMALQLLIEAQANALIQMSARVANQPALTETFLRELQDGFQAIPKTAKNAT